MSYRLWIITALYLFGCNSYKKEDYFHSICNEDIFVITHSFKTNKKIKDYLSRNKESKTGLYFIKIKNRQDEYTLMMSSMMSLDEFNELKPNKFEIIDDQLVLLKVEGCDASTINEESIQKYLPGLEKTWIKVNPNGDTLFYKKVTLYDPEVLEFTVSKDSL